MNIHELREKEEKAKLDKQKHEEWLKEKDWFIILDGKKLYDESGNVVFRLSQLKDNLEMFDDIRYKGKCEIVYRTNRWNESLDEFY